MSVVRRACRCTVLALLACALGGCVVIHKGRSACSWDDDGRRRSFADCVEELRSNRKQCYAAFGTEGDSDMGGLDSCLKGAELGFNECVGGLN